MNEEERRARLIGWLETIFADVQDLLLDNHLFWELQEIVRANPLFRECSGLFTQWMASSFVQATAVGVRRQAKSDKSSVSLPRFLNEIEKYPELVSRAHYIGLFAGKGPGHIEVAEEDFDEIAGEGGASIAVTVVQDHIRELGGAVQSIEHYVDRRVAHYDQRGPAGPIPTFDDLTASLETLERIVLFYLPLLEGSSMSTMLPQTQFDWKDLFRFAWLPTEDTDIE